MNVLSIENLTKSFGGLNAVSNVTLHIKSGEILSLIGPNGAGKTTLFNCVTGHYSPTEGSLIFEEKALNRLKPYQVTKMGIARTFQNIRLFPDMTVLENVMVGRHIHSKAGVIGAFLRFPKTKKEERGIWEKSKDYLLFVGLDKVMEERASNLPYGDQRRLEIARALATEPKLLCLDEPAAGMNPQESIELMKLIKKIIEKGITIFLIEHHMRVVMGISNRIYVMDHGSLIAEGNPSEIQKNPAVISAYLGEPENAST